MYLLHLVQCLHVHLVRQVLIHAHKGKQEAITYLKTFELKRVRVSHAINVCSMIRNTQPSWSTSRIDLLGSVVLIRERINDFSKLETDLLEVASAMEVEGLQPGCTAFVIFSILLVQGDVDRLDSAPRTSVEIVEIVGVLITAASMITSVDDVKDLVQKAFSNFVLCKPRVDVKVHVKSVAVHTPRVTDIIQTCEPNYPLGRIMLRGLLLPVVTFGDSNEERQALARDVINM